MRSLCLALSLLFWACGQGEVQAQSVSAPHIRVSILAPEVMAHGTSSFGILFEPDPDWHIYWKNPGDSGAAPKFDFTPADSVIGSVRWPYPKRIPFGDLTNLGFEGPSVFPFSVNTAGEKFELEINLEWLVCKEECIPGFATLKLHRKLGARDQWSAEKKSVFDLGLAQVPKDSASAPAKILTIESEEDQRLRVQLKKLASWGSPQSFDLFFEDGDYILPAKPEVQMAQDFIEFVFKTNPAREPASTFNFVLIRDAEAWELSYSKASNPLEWPAYLLLVLSAFLGGVILNLMPCVFPVLSIKALSFLKDIDAPKKISKGVALYTLGVLSTFSALGAGFLLLRAAGHSVGWGFQLQSPPVVLSLALLFWILALNFLGAIEFGDRMMNWAGQFQTRSSHFLTGVLSVFVAAPCTGPFMGSALGAATSLSAVPAMILFLSLGLGLSAPLIVLVFFPSLLRKIPRPGPWMETFKQFLAFPLFATVLWLLWVLGKQVGELAWPLSGGLLLASAFAIWLGRSQKLIFKGLAWILFITATLFVGKSLTSMDPSDRKPVESSSSWKNYSPEEVSRAREEGQAVFIDFTAAWCITCQWNKKSVLETPEAEALFKENSITLFRADWTNHDPQITATLSALGRNSIPVYAFYPKGLGSNAPPHLLPQILSLSILKQFINTNQGDAL